MNLRNWTVTLRCCHPCLTTLLSIRQDGGQIISLSLHKKYIFMLIFSILSKEKDKRSIKKSEETLNWKQVSLNKFIKSTARKYLSSDVYEQSVIEQIYIPVTTVLTPCFIKYISESVSSNASCLCNCYFELSVSWHFLRKLRLNCGLVWKY